MIRRPPRSTLFPTRRSSDLVARIELGAGEGEQQGEAVRHEDVTTVRTRSEEHTSELQSQSNLVCRLLLEKKKGKRRIRSFARTGLRAMRSSQLVLANGAAVA